MKPPSNLKEDDPAIIEHGDKKYTVIRELGKGHSGHVFLAHDSSGKEVAVKRLAGAIHKGSLKRFRHEFTILRSLAHPNIAQSIDFGFDRRRNEFFFVTEYVCGRSLDRALLNADEKTALDFFAQSLKALDYMHRQGVFHCDLKPENILVTEEGVVKIIDFDVATRGSTVIGGTPTYFAPELLVNLRTPPNAPSDLFSLGASFYHCLVRQKPYGGGDLDALKEAHRSHVPGLPSEVRPELGTVWDGLLMGLIQVNPSRRFATASAVLQQVEPLLGHRKSILSEIEIEYRLSQRGIPIGKEEILDRAQGFLEASLKTAKHEDRIWRIRGASGMGVSYVLDEIKTLAHLKGLECVVWNRYQQNFPRSYPFVWMIDDLSKSAEGDSSVPFLELTSKLKEVHYKGEGKIWWVVMEIADLPFLFEDRLMEWRLRPWSRAEIEQWLHDIFQTREIPPFLTDQILKEGGGNPEKSGHLLRHYLGKKLILDRQGHWRKDLFQPSRVFMDEFSDDPRSSQYELLFEGLEIGEKKILSLLATLYEPAPEECLEKILEDESIYRGLSRLKALKVISGRADEPYQIVHTGLKNYILDKLGTPEIRRRHDILRELAAHPSLKKYFSREALHYHKAHGNDPDLSGEGWAYFGNLSARHGLWQSAYEHYTKAYERIPKDRVEKRLEYGVQRGRCLIGRGRLFEAQVLLESLLHQYGSQKPRNLPLFAKIYERLGVLETKKNNLAEARRFFTEGIQCLEPEGEPLEHSLALKNFIAGLDLMSGDYARAIEEFKENYERAEKALPWERRRILTNNDLGEAYLKNGQTEEAIAHWKEVVEDLKKREDKGPLVRTYYQLAHAYLDRKDSEAALASLFEALKASQGTQNFEMELRIHNALANLYREQDPMKSLEMYEKALDAAFQTSDLFSTAVILLNMGFLLAEQEQPARAKHCLKQGLSYLDSVPEARVKYASFFHSAHLDLAQVTAELRQPEESLKNAFIAYEILKENQKLSHEKLNTYMTYWQALDLAGKKEEADRIHQELRELAKNTGDQIKLLEREMKMQKLKHQGKEKAPSGPSSPDSLVSPHAVTLVLKEEN